MDDAPPLAYRAYYLMGRANALQKGAQPKIPGALAPPYGPAADYWQDQGVRDVFADRPSRLNTEQLYWANNQPLPITFRRPAPGTNVAVQVPPNYQDYGSPTWVPPPVLNPQIGPNSASQGPYAADALHIGPSGEIMPLFQMLFGQGGNFGPPRGY